MTVPTQPPTLDLKVAQKPTARAAMGICGRFQSSGRDETDE
jgi:hypothetical protein